MEQDVFAAWRSGARNVLGVLPTGGGKCLGRGTPVMRYDGSVAPVEQIVVGDLLMGPDSTPRRVLSLASGIEPLYCVVPRKGDAYVVNESHVLSVKRTGIRSTPEYPSQQGGDVVNLTVLEWLDASATFRHEHKGWRVGVEFAPADPLPVDPYFLGLWLGDGNSHNATITTGDDEITFFLAEHAARIGMRLGFAENSPGSYYVKTMGLTHRGRGGTPLMNALRDLGVVNDKHVPHSYRTASRTDRLKLLAGVLDSDGYNSGKGFDLTLGNESLLDGVIFVARSLGFAAYKKHSRKTCVNNGVVGSYWRCSINGDIDAIPCRVKRKIAAPRRQKKNVRMVGIQVVPIGEGDYFGFEIDGDRLFLLGDFTVTHNTFVFSRIANAIQTAVCAMAHRSELIGQMSLALAREGVRHRIIGPDTLQRSCSTAHMDEFGRSFVDPGSRIVAASVDTLVRLDPATPWLQQIGLWIQDEAHHVLADNKWGKACALFPNAYGLGVTATPVRADGKGLGRHADGLMDVMIQGPTMRELIKRGYLTEYRIFAPPSDLDLSGVAVSAGGDYSPVPLRAAVHKSHITGDVVAHYLRIAPGKLGVTFAVDIEAATEIAAAYRAAGVPAEVVTSKTPDALRAQILRRFKAREILQLVNVDLFGEGFDLPAIEVVSMARPTQSYALFCQQFGRACRLMAGKVHALIIDHVGNVLRHGLPDAPREWSLDRRERRSRSAPSDVIPVRTCLEPTCVSVYERVLASCPFCGHTPVPAGRGAPEQVDGDLCELDPAVLAALRGEVARVDADPRYPVGAAPEVVGSINKRHIERQASQRDLRASVALWAGWQKSLGRDDAEGHRRFWFMYGTDVLSAQALGASDAEALKGRIDRTLEQNNIVTGH